MEEFKKLYEEIKKIPKENVENELIPKLLTMLDKAKEIGFVNIVKEIPDVMDNMRTIIAEFEPEEAIEIIKKYMPVVYDSVIDFVEQNEELQEELEDIEDTSLALMVDDADFTITLIIKDAKISYQMDIPENVDLTLKLNKSTMKNFMTNDMDPMQAYMSGEIKAEGNITKAMGLRPILDFISEELGIEILGL
ncbi:MAG: hypothetical protein EAX96_13380 [Candidatus Lokiarchaeota archaeon]|nr:hypothetical protein [Candidatus Lokiarchaeota archaeon]